MLLFLEPILIPAPSPEPYFMNSKGLEICRPSATQRVEILPRPTFSLSLFLDHDFLQQNWCTGFSVKRKHLELGCEEKRAIKLLA